MKLEEAITLGILFVPLVMFAYVLHTNPGILATWAEESPDGLVLLIMYCAVMLLLSPLLVFSALAETLNDFFAQIRERKALSEHTIIPYYEPPANIHPAVAGFLIDKVLGEREFYATLFQLIIEGNLAIDERKVGKKYKYYLIKNQGFDSSNSCGRLMSDNIFYKDGENLDTYPFDKIENDPSFLSEFIRSEMIRLGYFENPYTFIPTTNDSEAYKKYKKEWIDSVEHSWSYLGESQEQKKRRKEGRIREIETFFKRLEKIKLIKKLKPGHHSWDMIYTKAGKEERIKWLGFRDYLQTAERFRLDEEKVETFSKYLPYAIALGVETEWAHRFEDIEIDRLEWFQSQVLEEIKRHDKIYYKHLINFLGQIKIR